MVHKNIIRNVSTVWVATNNMFFLLFTSSFGQFQGVQRSVGKWFLVIETSGSPRA